MPLWLYGTAIQLTSLLCPLPARSSSAHLRPFEPRFGWQFAFWYDKVSNAVFPLSAELLHRTVIPSSRHPVIPSSRQMITNRVGVGVTTTTTLESNVSVLTRFRRFHPALLPALLIPLLALPFPLSPGTASGASDSVFGASASASAWALGISYFRPSVHLCLHPVPGISFAIPGNKFVGISILLPARVILYAFTGHRVICMSISLQVHGVHPSLFPAIGSSVSPSSSRPRVISFRPSVQLYIHLPPGSRGLSFAIPRNQFICIFISLPAPGNIIRYSWPSVHLHLHFPLGPSAVYMC